ncbi:hypothetical protein H0H93_010946 [Arthromyces matolae]|nr:hypothetical protein H0H93_010946 [Arthromyces matolae]
MDHLDPFLLDNQRRPNTLTLKAIIASSLITLLTISIPYEIRYRMTTFVPTRMPSAHSPSSPLLEILILSFPRPNPDVATTIMATTINSFIPHLTSNVTLSVFTHSTSHTAFANVQRMFTSTNVTFYTDNDTHPDHWPGQYLHIAEAFRWAMQRSNHAEWVMLVEDDFPMCAGDRGWDALKKVMQILESQISARSGAHAQGGFIGTGGSGLIIHHTMLPILILLMHTHAEIASKLPPTSIRRPADLVMQDCLLGADPLCARGDGKLVITSRLIMDHIGGMVTTNAYKALNDDKWRCGWRHAFHGYPNVEVVVV